MFEQTANKLFEPGEKIPRSLDELIEKFDAQYNREISQQLFELQQYLASPNPERDNAQIIIKLYALPNPVRQLVLTILDRSAWNYDLAVNDLRLIDDQVTLADELTNSVTAITNLSQLEAHIASLRSLPRLLFLTSTIDSQDGSQDNDMTISELALKLENIVASLKTLQKMESVLTETGTIRRVIRGALLNFTDGIPSDTTSQTNLKKQITQQIGQLPSRYWQPIEQIQL